MGSGGDTSIEELWKEVEGQKSRLGKGRQRMEKLRETMEDSFELSDELEHLLDSSMENLNEVYHAARAGLVAKGDSDIEESLIVPKLPGKTDKYADKLETKTEEILEYAEKSYWGIQGRIEMMAERLDVDVDMPSDLNTDNWEEIQASLDTAHRRFASKGEELEQKVEKEDKSQKERKLESAKNYEENSEEVYAMAEVWEEMAEKKREKAEESEDIPPSLKIEIADEMAEYAEQSHTKIEYIKTFYERIKDIPEKARELSEALTNIENNYAEN